MLVTPITPAGNSVYLANTPGSRPLSVVDRVPIKQGAWRSQQQGMAGQGVAVSSLLVSCQKPVSLSTCVLLSSSALNCCPCNVQCADESHEYCVRANGGSLTVTLVWTDFPALASGGLWT
jgi:hypothetical protein